MADNYFGQTDKGRQRDNNEDNFIARPVFGKKRILACVIDGVGGYSGGEIAAQITHDTILQKLNKLPADLVAAMLDALRTSNQKIFKEKQTSGQNEKMACVVTLAVIDHENNSLCYVHLGDTRLYLFRDNSLVKITRDHSTVGFLEESGRLSETAAMQHPKRNEVNKALGFDTEAPMADDFFDTGESPFLPGDIILLCSDGLTDMITTATISQVLKEKANLKIKAAKLIDAANEAGGKDNITVVLVENDKPPVKHEATKPPVVVKASEVPVAEVKEDFVTLPGNDVLKEDSVINKKGTSSALPLLIVLCIIFFAGFAWYFYKSLNTPEQPKTLMPPPAVIKKQSQLNLKDSADTAGSRLINLSAGKTLFISDSVFVDKDSLKINGNGAMLVADSGYNGAAFVLAANCKNIVLDSLTLSGFDIGILVKEKGLKLRNVRFINCRVPVQFETHLPQNIFISGTQAGQIFNQLDTTRK